jgi:hypothetical protein
VSWRKDQADRAHRVAFLRADEIAFIDHNASNWRTCCEHLPLFHEEWSSNGFYYMKCRIKGCPCEEHNDEMRRKAQEAEAARIDAILAARARFWRDVWCVAFGAAAVVLAFVYWAVLS